MSPPTLEVRRSNGQKISRLRPPTVTSFAATGRIVNLDDQSWRQTLTLNINLNQMNVRNTRRTLQFTVGGRRLSQIQDADDNWFLVRDWRGREWTSFVERYERVSESFWSQRFILVPPSSYDGMDWPQRRPTHRPNVVTAMDLNIRARPAAAYPSYVDGWRPVAVWKLATRADLPPRDVALPESVAAAARDIGQREFRSSGSTLIRSDAFRDRGRTAIHEAGHLGGQQHPGEWPGVNIPGCRDERSEHACYVGTRREHADNIMGTGRGILPENAEPWLDFIAAHTATRAEDWRAHVVGSDQPTPLPRPLTPPQTASRRAPSAPATP